MASHQKEYIEKGSLELLQISGVKKKKESSITSENQIGEEGWEKASYGISPSFLIIFIDTLKKKKKKNPNRKADSSDFEAYKNKTKTFYQNMRQDTGHKQKQFYKWWRDRGLR